MGDRAECPACGKMITTTKAGLMRAHDLNGERCSGAGVVSAPPAIVEDGACLCVVCGDPVISPDSRLQIQDSHICANKRCLDAAMSKLMNRIRRIREAYADHCLPDDGRPVIGVDTMAI